MKDILKEYLLGLKEDKELDAFCKELLISRNFVPLTKIQRGRQYGVDLAAIGQDDDGIRKLFLLVIKQGDLTRKIWDGGNVNDVRPSLTEIKDVFLRNGVSPNYKHLPVKIIVCFNGEFENALLQNWNGYIEANTTDIITYHYWHIDELMQQAVTYQAEEGLLPYDLSLKFRRVLAFIDLPDYPLNHLTDFISNLLIEDKKLSEKEILKKLRLVNLCISILTSWCRNSKNLKPSFYSIERILLYTFKWIYTNEYNNKKGVQKTIYDLLQNWRTHNWYYTSNIGNFVLAPDGLSYGIPNHNEYCLITFEQIGIFGLIGMYEIWECRMANAIESVETIEYAKAAMQNAEIIANMLAQIIKNNPSSKNVKYDEHCIDINLALMLFCEVGLYQVASEWLNELVTRLFMGVQMNGVIPTRDAMPEKIDERNIDTQKLSHYIYFLLEWCLILKQYQLYNELSSYIAEKLKAVNLQLWFPDEEVESKMFTEEASHLCGTTMTSLKAPKNYLELEMIMKDEQVYLCKENEFKIIKEGFDFIPLIASRHYRTYPFPNSWRKYLSSRFCFNNPT